MGARKRKKWRKITQTDRYSLFQSTTESHLFEVSWKRPGGNYGRRRFSAESPLKAIETAPEVAGIIRRPQREGEGLTMAGAFAEALSQTRRNVRTRKDWLNDQVRFLEWLDRHDPECTNWGFLRRSLLREYITETFPNCSPNRIRLALQPITQTANYMEREYNMPNVAKRLGIGTKLVKPPAIVYVVDVVDFLDWLKDRDISLEVGAALQGLAGLQLQEALRLTWDKVDLDEGLIEISGEVKNDYRKRVLPVCQRVRESLLRAASLAQVERVQSVRDPVVRMERGGSYAESDHGWRRYSRYLSGAMKRWNRSIEWAPKDLRNCLPTFAVANGLHSDLWEQYLGHAPRTVTGRHYIPRVGSVSRGEAAALKQQMDLFRAGVVDPLERSMNRGTAAPILNIFEQSAAEVLPQGLTQAPKFSKIKGSSVGVGSSVG